MSLPTSQSNEKWDSISNVLPGNFMKVREKEVKMCMFITYNTSSSIMLNGHNQAQLIYLTLVLISFV